MTLAQITRRLIGRAAIAAALVGIVLTAGAFSSEESFTEADLLEDLRERGLLFQLYHEDSDTLESFSRMNGFLTTNELRWTPYERLFVSHFSGRGEAVVAASRISIDGFTSRYPDDTYTEWVTASDNIGFPVNRYQRGSLIITYIGRSAAVPEALDEIMGKPFAGDRALGDRLRLGDDFPLFRNLWREHHTEFRSISHRKNGYAIAGNTWRIDFEARVLYSSACAGSPHTVTGEVVGNEIRITSTQKVLDPGIAELTEPCEMDWRWHAASFHVPDLPYGATYSLVINDEYVTGITPKIR